ncbi:serotransferrin [Pan troglodytes]|uniref:serotransferrin n=1 Tax=Pan troglodytes TaxID=9598 RepID=UPI000511C897
MSDHEATKCTSFRDNTKKVFPADGPLVTCVERASSLEYIKAITEHFGKDKSSEFQLFGSPHETDLLFTDAAHGFLMVPPKMDAKLYLGYEYFSATQDPKRGYYVMAVVKKSDADVTWNSL